jgi:hypothetical protein
MGAILIRVGAILLNVGRFDLKLNLNTLMLLKFKMMNLVLIRKDTEPFYFDFHSARIIFDVSSGFYLWNINNTKADICKK